MITAYKDTERMDTKILTNSREDIAAAAEILKSGGLVAIPTETVYGLAANALDEDAVKSIFAAKGRAQDNPLIVHIADMSGLSPLVREIPACVTALAEKFWPGPLTMIMKKSDAVAPAVTCGGDTVAVRMPQNEIARAIIAAAGLPLAAPSANLSGGVSPVSAAHCIADLDGRVDAVLDGGECSVGLESTVLLCTTDPPRLLRPGFVTVEQIESVIGKIEVDDAVLHPLKEGEKPASPGMKYKHYSPRANVIIVDADSDGYADFVNGIAGERVFALCFEEDCARMKVPFLSYGGEKDGSSQAAALFSALRRFDELGAKTVYARMPDSCGVGLAVLNRLLRSAGFSVVRVT